MAKKALVVSGGGSKGAYAVGVIKFLKENFPSIEFDIFVGTSTGSLIVPLVASDNLPLLETLYSTVSTNNIVTKGNLLERFQTSVSFFDAQPLANLIGQYINDAVCQRIFTSGKQVFICTTCLQTAETVVWSTAPKPDGSDYHVEQVDQPKHLRRAILASANQPVFMQPVAIRDEDPLRQYVDGGVREYLGIQMAMDAGAEEIFAISLAPPQKDPVNTEYKHVYEVLQRTIDIFTEDVGWSDVKLPRVYNRALRYIAAVQQKMKDAGMADSEIEGYFNIPQSEEFVGKKPVRIHHIYPEHPLNGGPGGLDFNPANMQAMMKEGKNRIQNYMASLNGRSGGNV